MWPPKRKTWFRRSSLIPYSLVTFQQNNNVNFFCNMESKINTTPSEHRFYNLFQLMSHNLSYLSAQLAVEELANIEHHSKIGSDMNDFESHRYNFETATFLQLFKFCAIKWISCFIFYWVSILTSNLTSLSCRLYCICFLWPIDLYVPLSCFNLQTK